MRRKARANRLDVYVCRWSSQTMEGFECLPVAFQSSRGGLKSGHVIFCKKHSVRQNSLATPNGRTLFTLGWPPYCKGQAIEELFSRAGHVTAVYLQSSPGPVDPSSDADPPCGVFTVAYVVFAAESDADSALQLCHAPTPIDCPVGPLGLQKWTTEYQMGRPTRASLEKGAEVGVALYDRQQEEAKRLKVKAGMPDEDGWITVTRKTPRTLVWRENSLYFS